MPKNVAPDKTLEAFGTQTFGATFAPDITDVSIVKVTLTGNITSLNAPTGRAFGLFTLVFVQDATGGRTITWNGTDYPDFSVVGWNPGLDANAVSSISFFYDSNSSKWRPFSTFNGDVWMGVPGTNSTNAIRVGDQTLKRTATGTIGANSIFSASTLSASGTVQGPTVQGGTGSGGNLTLTSTSSGTKGKIFLGSGGANSAFDETNKRLGIGNVSPTVALDVTGAGLFSSTVTAADPTASTHLTTKNYVDQRQLGVMATSTTAIGTTITAVTGLSIASVPAGTWSIYAYVPIVTVGSPTAFTVTVSPSSAPTTSTLRLMATTRRNGTADGVGESATFSNAMALGVQSAVPTILEVYGGMVSSTTGTISISATRTGGTSMTVQAGAYLRLERLA